MCILLQSVANVSNALQTMDMTVAELHHAISNQPSVALMQPGRPFPIQAVTFPTSDPRAGIASLSKHTPTDKSCSSIPEHT